MKKIYNICLFVILFLGVLTGCNSIQEKNSVSDVAEVSPTISPTIKLATETPIPLPTSTQTPTQTFTPTLTPTAAPFLYQPDGEVISKDNYDQLEKYKTIGKGSIYLISSSSDGEQFVVQTNRGVFIYMVETLEQIAFFEDYSSFVLLPDGLEIAVVTPELVVEIIEIKSGEIKNTIEIEAPVHITGITFSNDGSLMAVSITQNHATRVDYLSNRIDVIDWHENKLLARLESDIVGDCSKIAFSPDNTQLLTYCFPPQMMGYPRTVNWSVSDQSVTWSLTNEGSFGDLPFSPNSDYVITSTSTETTLRWAFNGQEVLSFRGGLNENSFSPDGRYFAVSNNGFVYVWDTTNFQVVEKFLLGSISAMMSFSEDGEYLLANNGETAWRTSDYELDESYISDRVAPPEVDMSRMREIGHLSDISGVVERADGTLLAWGYSGSGLLWWWYPETSEYHEITLEGGTGAPTLSPNNDQIAVCLTGGLTLVDLASEEMSVVTPCRSGFTYLAFSGDAESIFMSYGTLINQVDLETGESLRQLRGHTYNVGKIKLSEDGKYLISMSAEATGSGFEAVVWGLDPYTIIQKWMIPATSGLRDAYFTADGAEVIALNSEITVWRLSDLWYLANISGSTFTLSPDNTLAAVGKGDAGFMFYDTSDWSLINDETSETGGYDMGIPIEYYIYYLSSSTTLVKFLNDGQVLLSVNNDLIELWHIQ